MRSQISSLLPVVPMLRKSTCVLPPTARQAAPPTPGARAGLGLGAGLAVAGPSFAFDRLFGLDQNRKVITHRSSHYDKWSVLPKVEAPDDTADCVVCVRTPRVPWR